MTRRFLVTGGAEFVGSHMVAAPRDRGEEVVVVDNLHTGHRGAVPSDARLIEADLGDAERLDSVLADSLCAAEVNFAGWTRVRESTRIPIRYLLEHAGVGFRLIDACVRRGVNCLVFSSTAALFNGNVDGRIADDAPIDPQSPYGDVKWMVERALYWAWITHGSHSARLRYFNATGADPAGLVAAWDRARAAGWLQRFEALDAIVHTALVWREAHPGGYGR